MISYGLNHIIKWKFLTILVRWLCRKKWKDRMYIPLISFISNKLTELGFPAQVVCCWLNSFYKSKTEIFQNLGLYFNLACFNFITLIRFNRHWRASSIRISYESSSLSPLNVLLDLELLDIWSSWPVMILSKKFMVKVKP